MRAGAVRTVMCIPEAFTDHQRAPLKCSFYKIPPLPKGFQRPAAPSHLMVQGVRTVLECLNLILLPEGITAQSPKQHITYRQRNEISRCVGGGSANFMHGRSRMTIDPRITTMPGRSTSGSHGPGRHCVHQVRSAVKCSASRMEVGGGWSRMEVGGVGGARDVLICCLP